VTFEKILHVVMTSILSDFFLNFVIIIIYHFQEIYPPKISEFAYVTDGACTESEILDQELLMLKVSQLWVISNHW